MKSFKSEFLHIMQARGFIHQISDPETLDTLLSEKNPITAYIGFDATAKSLHAGSLIQIMMLYWLQKTGHRPLVLMGGATSMIGDPSFRDEARKMLSAQEIFNNITKIQENFTPYLSFGSQPTDAHLVNNKDWLMSLSYIDFLRDIGQHFSVNRMLSFDSVKLRLEREQSLSFLEFNYMVLQAYDFVELSKRYDCRLQMGGSDQWGNIINGIDLGRRKETPHLFALTTPLLTTSAGLKMGKTGSQTVWLNPEMCSPYDFWQYWRNVEDNDVIRFLKLYTPLPLDEIDRLSTLKGSEINHAKKILATEITTLLHGKQQAENAENAARRTFEDNILSPDLPTLGIHATEYAKGVGILTLLVKAGLASSNSAARRSIKEGAVRLNNNLVTEEDMIITQEHFEDNDSLKLSFGKKKHIVLHSIK